MTWQASRKIMLSSRALRLRSGEPKRGDLRESIACGRLPASPSQGGLRRFTPRNDKTYTVWSLLILALFILACAQPAESPEQRVERIGKQLRCPVCRGVAIADSPATLAVEMMGVVRVKVAEGKSDEEIFRYFEERYGEWALLSPKAEGMNLLIWILPALFIVGGAVFILYQAKKEKGSTET